MTKHKNRIDEEFFSDLVGSIKSLADIPIIKKTLEFFAGDEEEDELAATQQAQEKERIDREVEQIGSEMVPLNKALEALTNKSAIILGSSQAGVIGHPVMRALEMRGFTNFDFKPIPAKTMSFVYASTLSRIKDKSKFDVAIIFPGFKSGEQIESVIDLIDFFTPARCFVVIPPPVTNITNTIEAARLGLNKGMAIPPDFWFALRKGMYASERENYCESLKQAVISEGSTPIDPRDVVTSGEMQPSGVSFPNSPDGIHPSPIVSEMIADAVGDAITNCTIPVPVTDVLAKIPPNNQMALQKARAALSDAPSAQSILSATPSADTGIDSDSQVQRSGTRSDRVSSGFGRRNDPFTGKPSDHQGLDISAKIGTEVKAALSGTVTRIVPPPGGARAGSYVEITHDNGDVTRYLHLSKPLVTSGQRVSTGDVIALSGNTGRSTGPHLHWETWEDGGFRQGRLAEPLQWMSRNPGSIKPVDF